MSDIWEKTHNTKTTYPPVLNSMTINGMSDNSLVSVNICTSLNGITTVFPLQTVKKYEEIIQITQKK